MQSERIWPFLCISMSTFARIPALDGVRGLATLMVLSSHFLLDDVYSGSKWWHIMDIGWIGVDLFFVLSGYLITSILLDTKERSNYFREFYRRRVLRIFPLYYSVLLFSVFAITVIDRKPENLWNGYDSLAWFFAFIPNVAIAFKGGDLWQTNWAGLHHLWSLAVEEQYYIFWPLVVWLLPRRPLVLFCIVLLYAGVFFREWTDLAFGSPWSYASYVLPYCRMDGLAGGSLLAVLLRSGWMSRLKLEREVMRDLTFMCGMILFYLMIAGNSQGRGTIIALMFVGIVYLTLSGEGLLHSIFKTRFLRHIGTYSYGLYVFHQMFRMPFKWYIRDPLEATGMPELGVQVLYMLLAFGATYGLARLSWTFLEKPFLNLKDRKKGVMNNE